MEDGPRVVHLRRRRPGRQTAYVGRPGNWGNPFRMRQERDRKHSIELYARWIDGDPEARRLAGRRPPTREEIRRGLRGMDLACWCAPKACHADVLLRIANS